MNTVAKVVEPLTPQENEAVRPQYLEALHLVERLHRRLLDVIAAAALEFVLDDVEQTTMQTLDEMQSLKVLRPNDSLFLKSRRLRNFCHSIHNGLTVVCAGYAGLFVRPKLHCANENEFK